MQGIRRSTQEINMTFSSQMASLQSELLKANGEEFVDLLVDAKERSGTSLEYYMRVKGILELILNSTLSHEVKQETRILLERTQSLIGPP